jgi:hypothetical protein
MITIILSRNDAVRFGGIDYLKQFSAEHSRNILIPNYLIIVKGDLQWLEN